ncbi:hypothetical protein [Oceanitalea stevensii]|uniref:Uncharacterized protein n=1 Tax=Oceanitalea stevensii TaxID=2763072 RepID=A0ABR8YY38_9MICO|nr:hypothetical protein [Oceanitalea stevensii]MBD8060987.1 hypothetical protein [Oceanitalea stevensii]
MKKAMLVINSVVGGTLLTLAVVVLSLLFLMFSVGEGLGRREGLFGSLYFEATSVSGGVDATMGVNNTVGIVGVLLVCIALIALVQLAYLGLKRYRAELIRERAQPSGSA